VHGENERGGLDPRGMLANEFDVRIKGAATGGRDRAPTPPRNYSILSFHRVGSAAEAVQRPIAKSATRGSQKLAEARRCVRGALGPRWNLRGDAKCMSRLCRPVCSMFFFAASEVHAGLKS
jgi:hypothetical protein